MLAVSSCIAGIKCRYNATDSYKPSVLKELNEKYIIVCPEILAGFGIPRTACEIAGGGGEDVLAGTARVLDKGGNDVTEAMIQGAEKALRVCLENGVKKAYLKSKSPTCGYGKIHDGSFSGTTKQGNGVFAALLIRHGIEVVEIS